MHGLDRPASGRSLPYRVPGAFPGPESDPVPSFDESVGGICGVRHLQEEEPAGKVPGTRGGAYLHILCDAAPNGLDDLTSPSMHGLDRPASGRPLPHRVPGAFPGPESDPVPSFDESVGGICGVRHLQEEEPARPQSTMKCP